METKTSAGYRVHEQVTALMREQRGLSYSEAMNVVLNIDPTTPTSRESLALGSTPRTMRKPVISTMLIGATPRFVAVDCITGSSSGFSPSSYRLTRY